MVRNLSKYSYWLAIMLVGCAVTPPVIQHQPGRRTLVVMCPIRGSDGDRVMYLSNASTSFAEGPIRFIINGHDTFWVLMREISRTNGFGNFSAWRLEVSAPLSQPICVRYTNIVTRRSVINTTQTVDTTVCFAATDTIPRFVVFSNQFPRRFSTKPFLVRPLMFTDAQLRPALLRKLRRRWHGMSVEKIQF